MILIFLKQGWWNIVLVAFDLQFVGRWTLGGHEDIRENEMGR